MAPSEAAIEFYDTVKVDADNCLVLKFPERKIHLNELLKMPEFCIAANDIKCKLETPTILKMENNVNNSDGKKSEKIPCLNSNSHDSITRQMLICSYYPTKNLLKSLKFLNPISNNQLKTPKLLLKMWVSLLVINIKN